MSEQTTAQRWTREQAEHIARELAKLLPKMKPDAVEVKP